MNNHKLNAPKNHHQDQVIEHFRYPSGIAGSESVQLLSYTNESSSCSACLLPLCIFCQPLRCVCSSITGWFEFAFPWWTVQLRTFSYLLAIWISSFVKYLFRSLVLSIFESLSLLSFSYLFEGILYHLYTFLVSCGLLFYSLKCVSWRTKLCVNIIQFFFFMVSTFRVLFKNLPLQDHENILLCYILEALLFYFSYSELQSTWNWVFYMCK